MTATLGDAPDWQGYSQWRASQGTVIDETISLGNPFTSKVVVTNWASFNLYAVLNSGTGFTVVVTWFNDAAYSEVVDTQTWVLGDSSILNVTLPCLTPYASIEFTTGESGNQTITAYFTPQNLAVTKATYLTDNNIVSEYELTLTAGQSKTYLLPYVTVGPCVLALTPRDTSGKVYAQVFYNLENGGGGGTIAGVQAGTVEYVTALQQSVTPAYPCGLYLSNTDGSNSHEVDVYLVAISQ